MKVDDLQQYLSDLARLVQASDGKKAASGLTRIAAGLQPFRDYDLDTFAGFLARAEDYSRTGILPVVTATAKARPKVPAKSKVDLSALRAETEHLYSTAGSAEITMERIQALAGRLEPLKKDELAEIAQAIGLVGMGKKTKPAIVETIIARIRSIKQSYMRTSIIDRPGTN